MRIQRRMYEANKALSYFVTHNWDFKNDNFLKLCSYLRPEDYKAFEYRHLFNFDCILFARLTVYGFRKFLCNENDDSLEEDRKFAIRCDRVIKSIQYLFYAAVAYVLLVKYDILKFLR
jgi:hypothetical protein